MKVAHLNVRSLFTGFDELRIIIEDNVLDICMLTETWLCDAVAYDAFNIPGYNFVRKDRIGRGGGIAFFIKNTLAYEIVCFDFEVCERLEYLFLKIKVKNNLFAFGAFYRPPNTRINSFIADFDNIFSFLCPMVDHVVCMGDFNVNLLNLDNPLSRCFENYNFVQLINEPTRISSTASTLLDPIFVTDSEIVSNVGTLSADSISDHRLVFCKLDIVKPRTPQKIITYRLFKNLNFQSFSSDLYNLPWYLILYETNIDCKISMINNFILTLFDIHAPIVQARVSKVKAPWLTSDIKMFMDLRDRSLQKYKQSGLNDDWVQYKRLRNFTLNSVRKAKKNYMNSVCSENNSAKTWRTLRNFSIGSKKLYSVPQNLADPEAISAYFRPYLQVASDCSEKVDFYKNQSKQNSNKFNFNLATVESVHKILNSIKTNASGIDGISATMLKYCSPFIDPYIVHIINCCIETQYFPDQWKISIGKPIPKVSHPADHGDLRIVSILPVLSKIFEKILFEQIYAFVLQNDILPSSQCGFRKGHSTSVALTSVVDDIILARDRGKDVALVLLDFSKAFDTINHDLLCAKLCYYGFGDESVNLMTSYLCNRKQKIFSSDEYSNEIKILSGVPQGSILGPLLFIIYTADILTSINGCKVQAYADDTQLYFDFDFNEYIQATEIINRDLEVIKKVSSDHNLLLNSAKSRVLIFSNKNHANFLDQNLNIQLDGLMLQKVKCYRNLGLLIDSELRFREHIKQLHRRSFTTLKLIFANRHILNTRLRKQLCESLVLSHYNYCDHIYGFSIDVLDKYRVQKVQNACCRLIFGLRKYDHVSHTHRVLNWLTMENRRVLHFGCFIYHIINGKDPPYALRNKLVFRSSVHSREIRHKYKLTMPLHRTSLFQRCFSFNCVRVFNSCLDGIIELDLIKFKTALKRTLLSRQNNAD